MIKSFCRYTAVEQPDHLHQVTQVLAIRQKKTPAPQLGYLTADEVKTLLAEPGATSARAVRDTVLLALAYATAARVQELCDLDVADIRRSKPMTVTIRGKGSKIQYVPMMDPTAQLVADYLHHRDCHPGLGAEADPLFHGPNHSRLTRSGVAKSVYFPLSADIARRKVELLHKCFPSQRDRDWWDDEVFLGMARLRGMECRAPYAEAFGCAKSVITVAR